jgi:catechol 2,3-dioxygenase-like lactoylglutathione lyase family enzyme
MAYTMGYDLTPVLRAGVNGLAVREVKMKRISMFFLAGVLVSPGPLALGADPSQPIVESLGHVAMGISDVQPALHFYIDQLGLKEAFRLNSPDGKPYLIYLRVADTNTFVELFPGKISAASVPPTIVNHLGFFVKDLQATLHALQERGYPLPDDAFEKAKKVQADNTLLYFIRDPDGNKIELSQLRPDSLQVTSRSRK